MPSAELLLALGIIALVPYLCIACGPGNTHKIKIGEVCIYKI